MQIGSVVFGLLNFSILIILKMKLLIAGAGFIVQDWLQITKDLSKVELTGIAGTENDLTTMKELAKQYNIQNIYTDYATALRETNADTVYVAVPNFLHYSFVKQALLANKNVICEKPFTVKYDEFKKLKQLALEKDLILAEAITNQYSTYDRFTLPGLLYFAANFSC